MSCLCGGGKNRANGKLDKNKLGFDAYVVIKEIRLFNGYSEEAKDTLCRSMTSKTFPAGGYLMRKGETGAEFFIIVEGDCSVLDGNNHVVAQLHPGDYCGEQSLIRRQKRNASIRAEGVVKTLVCDKKTFDELVSKNVQFTRRVPQRKAVLAAVNSSIDLPAGAHTEKSEETRQWLLEMVKENMMFSHLSDEQRLGVIDQMYLEKVPEGTDLITQGDTNAQTFYVVAKGSFDVYVNGEHVAEIGHGGCFGELALMYKAPRAATCRAGEDSEVWTVVRNSFRTVLALQGREKMKKNVFFLKTIPLFSRLLHGEIVAIDQALEEKHYPAKSIIIKQGDAPDKFYLIKEGSAKWLKTDGAGNKQQGDIDLVKKRYFGELALTTAKIRQASVFAGKNGVTCLEMSASDFTNLLGPLEAILNRNADVYKDFEDIASPQPTGVLKPKVCQLHELETIGILGKGAFGLVTLVYDPISKCGYALKAIRKAQIVELGQQSHIVNEKRVMELMNNQFLVNLRGTFKDKYRVYFLLDVCLGGELFTILRKRRYFNEPASKFFAGCVVEAFHYMHSKRIIYRDLKPENLVLDDKGYLKIADFGFAKVVKDKTFTLCGTPDYLAPEIVTGQGHGKGVDWWTLGILIYEMLASFPPFYDDEPIETYRKIIKCKLKFPRYFTEEAKQLIKGLLRQKATKRLGVLRGGAETIRQHPWFHDFSWNQLREFTLKPPIEPKVKDVKDISNFESSNVKDDEALVAVDPKEDFDSEF